MAELIPIVFNQATHLQRQVILKLIENENKKMLARDTLKQDDVGKLFDFMDEKHSGVLNLEQVVKAMETLQVRHEHTDRRGHS
jgi:hypothetical protein